MITIKSEATYESIFALMTKSDEDEDEATLKGINQRWYMDSGCSKHMTRSTDDFLSLKALQGESVSLGNDKNGYIIGVGKIGNTPTRSIENTHYVNDLKYSLLSVSQICDKGNKVEFLPKSFITTNPVTGEVVLVAKRFKNIYAIDFESLNSGDLICLGVVVDDAELCHRRLGHASFSLLNKLIKMDLICGLLKSKFNDHKVCDACVKGKQVRSSFKQRRKTKDETFPVFAAFVKRIQDTPIKGHVLERKNRTFEDMSRTLLIDSGLPKSFWAEIVPSQQDPV
ncbi:uncharacterized protein LOC142176200 [Nicotiana tabacum]|uniref:Uncharacterized protein LOC142176200 n=1 Tax=Nicotiana tabacum TaxID=4097 RepID=A0AC58TQB9_TOBAC